MSKDYIDMIGRRYEKLLVVEYAGTHQTPSGYNTHMWRCKCDCGKEVVASGKNLRANRYVSCGCSKAERITEANLKHGGAFKKHEERLYGIWKTMKKRCNNPKDKRYHRYGGRGISVCQEWENDYRAFRDWAFSAGYDPAAPFGSCTIDRIDNNGNYEPSNCRWADMKTQANNTSRNRAAKMDGGADNG